MLMTWDAGQVMRRVLVWTGWLSLTFAGAGAFGQSSSSSSDAAAKPQPTTRQGLRQADAAGSAITLEETEPLFDVATALNACGYDSGLAESNPVRAEVRADVAAAVTASPEAQKAQTALCGYVTEHALSDKARELAQYVSLALYLGPAPGLQPTAEETELPPDAEAVVNVLPLLRGFAAAAGLHGIWIKHHAEYQAITDRVHDPVTKLILDTNIYIKASVSSYDGRRLLILVEPMLAPNAPNGRIYGSDYALVTSPNAAGAIRMAEIRHLYLQYEIEPLVYARAQSMVRLTPLLKPVADAPLEYVYKTDVIALVTECLIKAIEARTMDTGYVPPAKPAGTRARIDLARYDEELAAYDRQAEGIRRKQVVLDMRQGWVLTDYFYGQVQALEHSPESLAENMGQMVYGMDVGRERHQAEQIQFLPQGSGSFVRKVAAVPTGLRLAEMKLMQGDLATAEQLADRALADPAQDHAEATYVKARVALMEGDPETSSADFTSVVHDSQNPRTVAWAHVYLGRLYDIKVPAERDRALAEYKAALAVPGVQPDASAAASTGLRTPFVVPQTEHHQEEPLDPSGKAEKEAYKPE